MLVALVFWILVWQLDAMAMGKELLLPMPWTVLRTLVVSAAAPSFWRTALTSLLRVLLGFLTGVAAGILLGVATAFSRLCDWIFSPFVRVVRATPVTSFILLALLWLRSTILPGFISALMVLPVVWGNVAEGIAKTDPQLLEMAQTYGFSRWKTLRLIYLPSLRPWIGSACLTSLGLAWKSGVAAEVLCQPKIAIGTQLYYAKIYLETDQLFAWTVVVIVLSVLLEQLLRRLLKRIG